MAYYFNRSESDKSALAIDICDYLNDLLEIDKEAICALFAVRAKCNEDMSNHCTVQVYKDSVGVIGLLNGFIGVDYSQCGYITMVYEGDELLRFVPRYVCASGSDDPKETRDGWTIR